MTLNWGGAGQGPNRECSCGHGQVWHAYKHKCRILHCPCLEFEETPVYAMGADGAWTSFRLKKSVGAGPSS